MLAEGEDEVYAPCAYATLTRPAVQLCARRERMSFACLPQLEAASFGRTGQARNASVLVRWNAVECYAERIDLGRFSGPSRCNGKDRVQVSGDPGPVPLLSNRARGWCRHALRHEADHASYAGFATDIEPISLKAIGQTLG